ncbi:MAG: hypothetical protein K1X92_08960 [Bacteroidia bacterium]|nr:hypothetical protein [Bacteroidia bacterium]
MDALIQHYLHCNPCELPDETYALVWAKTKFLMEWIDKKQAKIWGG